MAKFSIILQTKSLRRISTPTTLCVFFGIALIFFLFFLSNQQSTTSAHSHLPVTLSPSNTETTTQVSFNYLDRQQYRAHPVFRTIDFSARPLNASLLVEPNGLLVPARFDCTIFNGDVSWGSHHYFVEIPTRWTACWAHHGLVKAHAPWEAPIMPLVDEEYFETIAVWDAVAKRANANAKKKKISSDDTFVVAEFGARWGTWAFRAIKYLRHIAPNARYDALIVEMLDVHCKGAHEVASLNDLRANVLCKRAEPDDLIAFAMNHSQIDLVDLDVQMAERDLFRDPKLYALFEAKVQRVIIATHSPKIHEEIRERFKGWILQHETKYSQNAKCAKCLRKRGEGWEIFNRDVASILRSGCFYETPYGKVSNWDGELILDNPKFSDGALLFPIENQNLEMKR